MSHRMLDCNNIREVGNCGVLDDTNIEVENVRYKESHESRCVP